MFNHRIIVTADQLSSGEIIEFKDISITTPIINIHTLIWVPTRLFPQQFQIINDTGGEISYNFLKDQYEYLHYGDYPELHHLIRVPFNSVAQDDVILQINGMLLIQGIATETYTKDLIVELLDYNPAHGVI